MTVKVLILYFELTLFIEGSKYIVETEGRISTITFFLFFNVEVEEPSDLMVKTEVQRVETNVISGDYNSGHKECSLRLVCRAPRKKKIKSGGCHFT